MRTKSYKDLIVWQKSIDLVLAIYKLTKKFPQEERYALVSQMRRAAVAIPSNIAEGYARQHKPEYVQFLSVAYASGAELKTQLIIAERLGYGDAKLYHGNSRLLEEVSKMLSVMIKKLKGAESGQR